MERRVSHVPSLSEAGSYLEKFPDCPFLSSRYIPVKDESRNMVVRTYFALEKNTKEEVVIKCLERGKVRCLNVR
jgi:hypothetical protein